MSVEQLHNQIHSDACCGGQFLSIATSAFEPLFFLHHTNIDRIWALWQAIRPKDAGWSVPYTGGSRYGTPGGSTISATSPLQPFFQANGNFHTAQSVKSYTKMGYAYQGLEYWQKTAKQMTSDAKALVNQLYGPGTNSKRTNKQARYFVEMSLELSEIERPCNFVASIKGNEAGRMVIMEMPASGILYGGLPIDDAVVESGVEGMQGDTLTTIQGLIQAQLVKPDGSEIAISSVPSFTVQVIQKNITIPAAWNEFPDILGTDTKTAIADGKRHKSKS